MNVSFRDDVIYAALFLVTWMHHMLSPKGSEVPQGCFEPSKSSQSLKYCWE